MRLRVWLVPLAEVSPRAHVQFEVLDAHRQIQHRDFMAINALPNGIPCELVLHPSDVILLDIRPPPLTGSRLAGALASLIEERIAGNVDDVHVVATPASSDGMATAAAVDRAQFSRALKVFAELDRAVIAAVPHPFALPLDSPDTWHANIVQGAGSVRTGEFTGCCFAQTDEVPVELRLLFGQTATAPETLNVDGDCDASLWTQTLGVSVKQSGPPIAAPAVPLNLMAYEFAPQFADWSRVRLPMALAVVLLLVTLVGLNAHAWKLQSQERALRERMTDVVMETIPGVPAVLDPLAQMQQRVDQLRASAGTDSKSFMSLTHDLASAVEVNSIQTLTYEKRALRIEFTSAITARPDLRTRLVTTLTKAGFNVRFQGDLALVQRQATPNGR